MKCGTGTAVPQHIFYTEKHSVFSPRSIFRFINPLKYRGEEETEGNQLIIYGTYNGFGFRRLTLSLFLLEFVTGLILSADG
jgi:hypothetical protein